MRDRGFGKRELQLRERLRRGQLEALLEAHCPLRTLSILHQALTHHPIETAELALDDSEQRLPLGISQLESDSPRTALCNDFQLVHVAPQLGIVVVTSCVLVAERSGLAREGQVGSGVLVLITALITGGGR